MSSHIECKKCNIKIDPKTTSIKCNKCGLETK